MTKVQKEKYQDTDKLREFLSQLKGKKFRLDCGHHVTFMHQLGGSITIYNDSQSPEIICSCCGY